MDTKRKQVDKNTGKRCVAQKRTKRERSEQKLRRSGWVRYGEIDVLSLHLQPQKHQVCGELQWSESSSALLQPRLKTHTYTEFNIHTHTYLRHKTNTHIPSQH